MAVQAPSHRARTGWPTHVGVGGVSLRGSHMDSTHLSPVRAHAALRRWLRTAHPDGAHPRVEHFPFREVVAHYQTVGRTAAGPRLVAELRDLHLRLPVPRAASEWMLADWLPSTFDQDDGDYDSYLVWALLKRLAPLGDEAGADRCYDMLLLALLADLLVTEAGALTANPDNKDQRTRTRAVLQALAHARELAPYAPATGLDPAGTRVMLAEEALASGQAVLRQASSEIRRVVGISMLPTTRLHDEHMFIRSVQIFEVLYQQVYRALVRALDALRVDDAATGCAWLDRAAARLAATSPLFRVLTTMPRDAFAVIRGYTDGRSAIQSQTYRQVEWVCAPRPRDLSGGKIPYIEVPAPTLQEVYLARAHLLPDRSAAAVREAMLRVDAAWRSMKRTHWGITLKIIGNVPGTGGTAGADYLKTTSAVPLFPLLADASRVVAAAGLA